MTDKSEDAQRRGAELIQFTAQLQTAAADLGDEPVDGPCGDRCACLAAHEPSPTSETGRPATSVPAGAAVAAMTVAAVLLLHRRHPDKADGFEPVPVELSACPTTSSAAEDRS